MTQLAWADALGRRRTLRHGAIVNKRDVETIGAVERKTFNDGRLTVGRSLRRDTLGSQELGGVLETDILRHA